VSLSINQKEPKAFGIGPKTARAVADPWRLRILTEVWLKPLSPSQFVNEFGGELTHISRCFRQLAKWGYIEVAEVRLGKRRGAAVEHLYRAIRRAHFDTPTWEGVPRNERDAASRSVLHAYRAHIRAAIESGTFDQEGDRHLSWDTVVLDETAWKQLGDRLDWILDGLAEHEVETSARFRNGKNQSLPVTVGLAAFRSPEPTWMMMQNSFRRGRKGLEPLADNVDVVGHKLAKALSNRWRCQIVSAVTLRPMSPSQFVAEIGGSMTHVSRCFRELTEWGFLEVFEERTGGRRGGVERIYRSTRRPYFDTPTWETLPLVVRTEVSQFILDTYFERVADAVEAGTFDADADRHLSWKPIVIDHSAWLSIGESLDDVLSWLPKLEEESLSRTKGMSCLIPATVGMAAFRSPPAAQSDS